jgi:hypothetical protein
MGDKKKLNPWTIGLIAAGIVIVVVNMAFVTKALQVQSNLVHSDYYEKSTRYDQQIENSQRLKDLSLLLNIRQNQGVWQATLMGTDSTVALPADSLFGDRASLNFYRPSDPDLDQRLELIKNPDVLSWTGNLNEFSPGEYKVTVTLSYKGEPISHTQSYFKD